MKHTGIINPQISTKNINKQLLKNLKIGVVDAKFQYIGDKQAESWLAKCNSDDYLHHRNFVNEIKNIAPKLSEYIKGDVNIVGLGIGNCAQEIILAQEFLKNKKVSLSMVDSSWELIHAALENAASLDIPKEAFWSDIVKSDAIKNIGDHVKRVHNPMNFYTLLGGTICNFPQSLIIKVLRDSLKKEDLLLVSFFGRRCSDVMQEIYDSADIVDAYRGESSKSHDLSTLEPFGITEEDGYMQVDYGIDKRIPFINIIERKFVFSNDCKVNFMDEDVYFAEGENILVGTSCVYSMDSVKHLFKSHGLRVVKSFEDKTKRYIHLLCKLG